MHVTVRIKTANPRKIATNAIPLNLQSNNTTNYNDKIIIPVVINSFGTVTKALLKGLEDLE